MGFYHTKIITPSFKIIIRQPLATQAGIDILKKGGNAAVSDYFTFSKYKKEKAIYDRKKN